MKDVKIKINSSNSMVYPDGDIVGINYENLQGNITFYFDEFVDGIGILELEMPNKTKGYIQITKIDETYVLPIKSSLLSQVGMVNMQLRITQAGNYELTQDTEYQDNKVYYRKDGELYIQLIKGTDYEVGDTIDTEVYELVHIPIFKSNIFYLKVKEAINATTTIPEDYPSWIDILNAKILEIDGKIAEVDNLDIDSQETDQGVDITITKKDGSTKTNTVKHGQDGPQGPQGIPGHTPLKGLDYWTEQDKEEIVEETKSEIEIPTKNSELENDSGYITNAVNNLINYYLKSETYTKIEVNNLIGQIQTVRIEVVQTLPTTGQSNVIYFVPKETPKTSDVYSEYIWTNNTWELIGTTQIDLTGYATEDWVEQQIADFLTQSQIQTLIATALTNYYTKTESDNRYVAKETGKGLSTNDYSTAEKNKVAGIEAGAEVNNVDDVQVNGVSVVTNKVANINLTGKQDKTDNTLQTTSKTVVGAINELNTGKVGFEDYAGTNVAGTIKTGYASISGEGKLRAFNRTYEQYLDDNIYTFIGKGTLENVFVGKGLIPTIVTSITSNTLVLNNHQEARLGTLATLILTMPSTIDDLYETNLTFTSGATATALTYSATPIYFVGDDCNSEGEFIPESNTTYEINIKKIDSTHIIARVGGVA